MGNTTTTGSKVGLKLFFVCFKKETFSAYLLNENKPLLLATLMIETGNLLSTVVASFFDCFFFVFFFKASALSLIAYEKQCQYEVGVSFDF